MPGKTPDDLKKAMEEAAKLAKSGAGRGPTDEEMQEALKDFRAFTTSDAAGPTADAFRQAQRDFDERDREVPIPSAFAEGAKVTEPESREEGKQPEIKWENFDQQGPGVAGRVDRSLGGEGNDSVQNDILSELRQMHATMRELPHLIKEALENG